MAELEPLNPAPMVGSENLEILATEAGRTTGGLIVSLLARDRRNGKHPLAGRMVHLLDEDERAAFGTRLAADGIAAPLVERLLLQLLELVETELRRQTAGARATEREGAAPRGHRDDASGTAQAQARALVPALHPAALHGLAGTLVRLIAPQTEAHPAALLLNLLVHFGNAAGTIPHAAVGRKRHGLNLFAVLVGRTSGGRKGTSRAEIDALFEKVDPTWHGTAVQSGLSSGEGLINAVRDPVVKEDKEGNPVVVDEGVTDKRLLVVEEEFCSPVKVMAREGNTLSAVVRQAWDGQTLRTLVRHSPLKATRPHISVLGHVTQPELLKYLTETEMADGFANRFLWVGVERAQFLPEGGEPVAWGDLVRQLGAALLFAKACTEPVARDAPARALWEHLYTHLTGERPGLFGAVTSRAEAQVLRISVLYALLDRSATVRLEHLQAAMAVWQYCEQSARLVFGPGTGDAVADRILLALQEAGERGLDLEATRQLFQRNVSSDRRRAALDRLVEAGLATCTVEETAGRPRTIYRSGGQGGAA